MAEKVLNSKACSPLKLRAYVATASTKTLVNNEKL